MGAYGKLVKGHDPEYYVRRMLKELAKTGASYYADAVIEHGEPEGTWVGEGLATLGIRDGDKVDHKAFLSLYDEFRDPRTGEHLGSPPRVNAQLTALFEQKKAAELGLTRTRARELWLEARSEVKSTGVMYYDGSFNVDKTMAAYASALALAKHARDLGDEACAAKHDAAADAFWAEIMTGVRVTISHLQREAAYVRTGHHGGKGPDGQPSGRPQCAYDIPVAIFPQFTNRDGEVHLHVHITFLNKVLTISDNKWRAPDAQGICSGISGVHTRRSGGWPGPGPHGGWVHMEVPAGVERPRHRRSARAGYPGALGPQPDGYRAQGSAGRRVRAPVRPRAGAGRVVLARAARVEAYPGAEAGRAG